MQVTKEVDQHGDIVFVDHKTNYKSILFKTYYVLEYAVTHYDVKFVLKTDDDAFINIAPLMNQLHLLCITEDCTNERIYMGRMAKESEVLLQPGHKWNNIVFHNHTGTYRSLTHSLPYQWLHDPDSSHLVAYSGSLPLAQSRHMWRKHSSHSCTMSSSMCCASLGTSRSAVNA